MSYLNKAEVKRYALSVARDYRQHNFSRVSRSFITALEERVRSIIFDSVKNHPTKGKTITELR